MAFTRRNRRYELGKRHNQSNVISILGEVVQGTLIGLGIMFIILFGLTLWGSSIVNTIACKVVGGW